MIQVESNQPRTAIFYFSGTGNTWWLSGVFAELMQEKGFHTNIYSIEKLKGTEVDKIISNSEMVGFGYPVYGSDLPQPMKEFIDRLPVVDKKDTFVFCTQWMWSGDGARVGADLLAMKGFDIKWAEHFLMPNNICTSVTWFVPYTNNKKKVARVLSKARERAIRFVEKMVHKRSFYRGFNSFSRFTGSWQRVPFQRMFNKLRNDIGIDESACIRCGLCERLCPSGNLVFSGEYFKTNGSCSLCLRCYNFCPVSAITYMSRPHNHKRGEPYKGPIHTFDPEVLCRGDGVIDN